MSVETLHQLARDRVEDLVEQAACIAWAIESQHYGTHTKQLEAVDRLVELADRLALLVPQFFDRTDPKRKQAEQAIATTWKVWRAINTTAWTWTDCRGYMVALDASWYRVRQAFE